MKKKPRTETRGRKKNLVKTISFNITLPEPYAIELAKIAKTWPGVTRAGLASHYIKRGVDIDLVKPLKVAK